MASAFDGLSFLYLLFLVVCLHYMIQSVEMQSMVINI